MSNPLLNLPPLDALRGFVAAARRMSITAAAQDLFLTQSAVSRQIQALEERLGTPLLVRGNRQIALTDAGAQLFALASPWLDQLADLTTSIRGGVLAAPVTISASIGVASLWILPRLGGFQAAHPDIDLRVETSNRVMDLKQEGIDLAIRYSPADSVPAGAVHLFAEDVVPVASAAMAATAFASDGALADHVLLELHDKSHTFLHWSPWLKARGIAPRPRGTLYFNQYDQLIQAAIEGNGVALGRIALLLPALRDGRLVARMESRDRVDSHAYWLLGGDGARPEVDIVRDWLLAQVAATVAELDDFIG
ncbi:LysR substrate-binding domain-containing protein [Pseudoduganella plicata]|uniref:LysR family transcriptional regulator n=1 Tax=Pseudoduganella plicata TaxID=321984 RepID=A0A4P7BIS7_9BURK|nr:LysR substrate-binding domain-containing protein [Pseudoduganella plicata]QBQ37555.1 LysR family transcriptional regulator [Pseudoduganella plicata]GGY91266.1 LysR family transcriptional regulator [Pseudoduganella plicata]